MATHSNNPHGQRSAAGRRHGAGPARPIVQPSRGLSLTEVLISLGVLAIGLLGVAAIFPVGSAYVLTADRTQRADAIAQAALSDAITRGLLDPERWVAYENTVAGANGRGWPAAEFTPLGRPGAYSRPYAADYRRRLAVAALLQLGDDAASNLEEQRRNAARLNAALGSVVVIDPTAVAAQTSVVGGADFDAMPQLASFPASASPAANNGVLFSTFVSGFTGGRWRPWTANPVGTPGLVTPLQRVTVALNPRGGAPAATPVLFAEAERIATASDDLAMEIGDDDDRPAQTRFVNLGGRPLLRQARQEFSYLLTVAPTTFDSHRSLANGGDGAYDVSAVVMNRRVLGARGDNPAMSPTTPQDFIDGSNRLQALQEGERLVRVSVRSPGPGASGGEVLMFRGEATPGLGNGPTTTPGRADTWWNDWLGDESPPWNDLRAGQWVFLFGPHPNSTDTRPLLFAQWYRVLAIDETFAEDATKARLRVQLRGPDWPWTLTENTNGDEFLPIATEGHLFAVIAPDVVAVHTRTLNLRSAARYGP